MEFMQLDCSAIRPNPFNPRKWFSGKDFDELVGSIKEKGVIQPILVRPIEDGDAAATHELVAGERRWRASLKAKKATIPCVVKEIDADTAFELLMIENLQREDLRPWEEARGFKMYLDRRGEPVEVLADRIKCEPSYIRRRLGILKLPKWILAAWNKGKLKFGHLELLSRMDPKEIRSYALEIIRHGMSVRRLKDSIEGQTVNLRRAPFDLTECLKCGQNTDVQRQLFAVDLNKSRCLKPECFKQKVREWLQQNKEKLCKKHKGSQIKQEDEVEDWYRKKWYSEVPKDCLSCKDLALGFGTYGEFEAHICLGDSACHSKMRSKMYGYSSSAPSGTSAEGRAATRMTQRTLEFREIFVKEEITRRVQPDDELCRRLSLVSLILSSWQARDSFCKKHKLTESYHPYSNVVQKILTMDAGDLPEEMRFLAVETLPSLAHETLLVAGVEAGIKLENDFLITAEYLKKFTKAELIELGKELKIWKTPEVEKFLFNEFDIVFLRPEKLSLKKGDLIRCFTESGLDLKGRVPAEIHDVKDEEYRKARARNGRKAHAAQTKENS